MLFCRLQSEGSVGYRPPKIITDPEQAAKLIAQKDDKSGLYRPILSGPDDASCGKSAQSGKCL